MKKAMGLAVLALALAACSGTSSSNTTTGGSGSSGSTGGSGSSGGTGSGGTTGTIDPGCGSVTVQGSCNGNTATFCAQGDLADGGTGTVTVDCSAYLPNNEPAQCATISPTYGVDCEAPTGQPCAFQDQSGNPIFAFCQGTTPGCFGAAGGFTCQNSAACTNFADGGFAPLCAGNQLQVGCRYTQAVGYDCAGLGGTCSNAACVGLPKNTPCDANTPALLVCNSGLTCTNLPDGGGHLCE